MAEIVPAIVAQEPRYQRASIDGQDLFIWHLDGASWFDAPPPACWHRHWPQTVGITARVGEVHRCPCGAIGGPLMRWGMLDERRTAPGWFRRWLSRRRV